MSKKNTDTTETPTPEAEDTPTGEPEAIEDAGAEPQEAPEDAEGGEEQSASAEAKRYRLELRATERRLEQLTAQVEAMQRGEVERVAGETVTNPKGIWAAGTEVADLLDDAGNIDEALVKEATITAAKTLGLARYPSMIVPTEGANPRHPGTRGDMEGVISGGL